MDLSEKLEILERRVRRLLEVSEARRRRVMELERENGLLKEQVAMEKRKAAAAAAEAEPLRRALEAERGLVDTLKRRIERLLKELEDVADGGEVGVGDVVGGVEEIEPEGAEIPDDEVEEDDEADPGEEPGLFGGVRPSGGRS